MAAEVEGDIDELVKFILIKASEHKLNTRKILASNGKVTEKLDKVISVRHDVTSDMNKAILLVKKSHKYQNVKPIKPGTKDYIALKTVAEKGYEFYKAYYSKNEKRLTAFVEYLETFLKINKKLVLNFIPSRHDRICEYFESNIAIRKDQNPVITQRLIKDYNQRVITQTGTLFVDYTSIPNEYVKFVKAAEICKELNIPAEAYLQAQFDRFSFFNSIPEPKDLISEKALTAIQRYVAKNPQYGKKAEISKERINRLKNIGKR